MVSSMPQQTQLQLSSSVWGWSAFLECLFLLWPWNMVFWCSDSASANMQRSFLYSIFISQRLRFIAPILHVIISYKYQNVSTLSRRIYNAPNPSRCVLWAASVLRCAPHVRTLHGYRVININTKLQNVRMQIKVALKCTPQTQSSRM